MAGPEGTNWIWHTCIARNGQGQLHHMLCKAATDFFHGWVRQREGRRGTGSGNPAPLPSCMTHASRMRQGVFTASKARFDAFACIVQHCIVWHCTVQAEPAGLHNSLQGSQSPYTLYDALCMYPHRRRGHVAPCHCTM